MEEHRARWPRARDLRSSQWQDCSAPATTVSLPAAAKVLGFTPDQAHDLAARGVFPCNVITTADGYRVPFGALMHLLKNCCPSSADDEET